MALLARIDWCILAIFTVLNTCGALVIYWMVVDPQVTANTRRILRNIIMYGYLHAFAGFFAGYGALRTVVDTSYLERGYEPVPNDDDVSGI